MLDRAANTLTHALAPLERPSYALLRIAFGLMFAFHGMQKLFGIMTGSQPAVGSQVWFGGILELVGGLAVALGAWTALAAFLVSGMMAVAYVQFHWKFQFDEKFFPARNDGEMALLYAFGFLFIACRGSGIWSLDHLRGRR